MEMNDLCLCLTKTPSGQFFQIARYVPDYKDNKWRTVHNHSVIGEVVWWSVLPKIMLGDSVIHNEGLEEIEAELKAAQDRSEAAKARKIERRENKRKKIEEEASTIYD